MAAGGINHLSCEDALIVMPTVKTVNSNAVVKAPRFCFGTNEKVNSRSEAASHRWHRARQSEQMSSWQRIAVRHNGCQLTGAGCERPNMVLSYETVYPGRNMTQHAALRNDKLIELAIKWDDIDDSNIGGAGKYKRLLGLNAKHGHQAHDIAGNERGPATSRCRGKTRKAYQIGE